MAQNAVEVTFVLPCLNEAEALGQVLTEIRNSYDTHPCTYEIVVADNGSSDGSQQIAASHGAHVVSVPERGYGAALRGGIAAAHGTFIIMGDADGSYLFADSWPMVERLRGGADLVMGDRFQGGIAPGAMPWLHRYIGNPLLSALGRFLFRVPVRDFHCGLRGFSVQSMQRLAPGSAGMEFASEMVILAGKRGYRIEEVPVRLEPDLRTRPPHLRTWRDGWRHLRFLFALSPAWTFLIPAIATAFLALFVAATATAGALNAGGVELSYRSSIVALVLALISTVATWSFVLARATLGGSSTRLTYATEVSGVIAIVVTLIGLAILASQLVSWGSTGFGFQPVGRNLFITIGGALLVGIGGISFFFALLTGLVRAMRP